MSREREPDVQLAIAWPAAPAHPDLNDDEVHVWAADLDVGSDVLKTLESTLSSVERERAGKFRFEPLQKRYTAGRGLLRLLLGRYLSVDAAKLDFAFSNRGKPALAEKFNASGIHFNLTHSENLALFAFTRLAPIGVDVERIRPIKDAAELVARFFSRRESDLFRSFAADQQQWAFFNLWTRKEALLKATGEGIAGRLNELEVTLLPGEPARLISISGDAEAGARWTLKELSPAKGFVGAIAVEARAVRVTWRQLTPPR